jgi:hypothetical protein
MVPQPSEVAKSLTRKYKALHEAFTALSVEATEFQISLPLTDKKDRGIFNSLSRIVAFSDHVHVALTLMGEDVHALEATYGESALTDWTEVDDHFDEWFTSMSTANAKVH